MMYAERTPHCSVVSEMPVLVVLPAECAMMCKVYAGSIRTMGHQMDTMIAVLQHFCAMLESDGCCTASSMIGSSNLHAVQLLKRV